MLNFGIGIGLSGQPQTYAGIANQNLQAAEARKAASAKADDDEWQNYLKSIKVEQVHRLDQSEANSSVAKTISEIQKIKSDPSRKYNWKNSVQQPLADLVNKQKEMIQRNEKLKQIETEYDAIKKQGGFTTPAQDKMVNAIRSGDWNQITNIQDEIGSVQVDPGTKGVAVNWVPQVDINKVNKEFVNNKDFKTNLTYSKGKVRLPNGAQVLATSSGIPVTQADAEMISKQLGQPVTSLEEINVNLLSDPSYVHAITAKQYASKRLPEGFSQLSDQEKYDMVLKNNMEDLKRVAGVDVNTSIVTPHKAAKKKDEPTKAGFDDLLRDKRIVQGEDLNIDYKGKKGVIAKADYSMSFKSDKSTVVTANADMIDLNGDPLKPNSGNKSVTDKKQFNFLPGSIKIISVKGKKEAYVFGQVTDKAVSEQPGQSDYTVTGDYAVPLKNVRNFVQNDLKQPTDWTDEAIERMNNQIEGWGDATPAAAPSTGKKFSKFKVKK